MKIVHTYENYEPKTEVKNLLHMYNNRVVRIVYGVCLNTERGTGHNIQTVRSHKSTAEKKKGGLNVMLYGMFCWRVTD